MKFEYNITYRQKDKGWQFIISYKDETGKWKQKSRQGFKTKKDAKPAAEKMVLELKSIINKNNSIINSDYDKVTFENVKNDFLNHKKLYIKTASYISYDQRLRVFDSLYPIPFINIKSTDIQKVLDNLVNNGCKYNTLKAYSEVIKLLFDFYRNNYNPGYQINLNLKLPKNVKSDKKALTKSELDDVLLFFKNKSFKNKWQYITCLIAGTCGLRFGEIMGLKWSDINYSNLTLHVERQYRQDINGNWEFVSTKSDNSNRYIPIPQSTFKELIKFKEDHPTDINNRIITSNPRTAQNLLNKNLNKIANISMHELRHTYITLLIASGIDFKTVAQLAGHDVQQTLKVYSHVTNDMVKLATNKIAEIF